MIEREDVSRVHESVETVDVADLYLRRLERKADIMMMDAKARQLPHRHDLDEVIALLVRLREVLKVRDRAK
jgi:hypothetical protein